MAAPSPVNEAFTCVVGRACQAHAYEDTPRAIAVLPAKEGFLVRRINLSRTRSRPHPRAATDPRALSVEEEKLVARISGVPSAIRDLSQGDSKMLIFLDRQREGGEQHERQWVHVDPSLEQVVVGGVSISQDYVLI